jgi:phenylacetate-CoA ligase
MHSFFLRIWGKRPAAQVHGLEKFKKGKFKEKIFRKLPYQLKVLAISYIGLKNHKKRFSGLYNYYYENYRQLWNAELNQVIKFQNKKIEQLLIEAISFSDWYKEKAAERRITIDDIKKDPVAALKRFPLLQKEERRNFTHKLLNKNPERKIAHVGYTSGTSGSPSLNLTDKESINAGFALWRRFHTTIGLPETKFKNVRFSGKIFVDPDCQTPPFWVYNFVEKQLLMSSYHLSDTHMKHYIAKLNSFRPLFLDGYPSAFYILADYIKRARLTLTFMPKAIATTSETLYDYQRKMIEEVFKCKVFNQYASSEGGPFITECKNGKLHINLDSGFFEFYRPDGTEAKPGDTAELVVTSLKTYKIPLIRYAIKDIVELPLNSQECGCGCKMPIVKKIVGREDDVLWTEDRGYVGRMDTAFKGLKHILKTQIIQKSPELIEIYCIVDNNYTEEIENIFMNNLRERLGVNIKIKFYYVDDISLSSNGKFDAVKREFPLPGVINN